MPWIPAITELKGIILSAAASSFNPSSTDPSISAASYSLGESSVLAPGNPCDPLLCTLTHDSKYFRQPCRLVGLARASKNGKIILVDSSAVIQLVCVGFPVDLLDSYVLVKEWTLCLEQCSISTPSQYIYLLCEPLAVMLLVSVGEFCCI